MQHYWLSLVPKAPTGEFPYVTAVNSAGQIVGGSGQHALTWDSDLSVTPFPFSGDHVSSKANGISGAGIVVGTHYYTYRRYAVVVDRGRKIHVGSWLEDHLDPPGPPYPHIKSEGVAINDRGVICGSVGWDGKRRPFLFDYEDYLYTPVDVLPAGHMEAGPKAMNNLGHMVGWSQTDDGHFHAFLWRDNTFFDLGPDVVIEDINDSDVIVGRRTGSVLGSCYADASTGPPFVFKDLPVTSDSATAINKSGAIIGGGIAGSIPVDVFIRFPDDHPEAGIVLLKDRILNLGSHTLRDVSDISDTGIVIGSLLSGSQRSFILYPVDLP